MTKLFLKTAPTFIPAVAQPEASEALTSAEVSRLVFDDLMDRDLLGFLLSSSHLHKYLAALCTYAEASVAEHVRRMIGNVDLSNQFHKTTLKMFAGSYIPETSIKDRGQLIAVLDHKYEAFLAGLDSAEDVRFETSLHQLESVELAWKYRTVCGNGRPLPFDF